MPRVAEVTGSEKSPPGGETAPTMLTLPSRSGLPVWEARIKFTHRMRSLSDMKSIEIFGTKIHQNILGEQSSNSSHVSRNKDLNVSTFSKSVVKILVLKGLIFHILRQIQKVPYFLKLGCGGFPIGVRIQTFLPDIVLKMVRNWDAIVQISGKEPY
jgi:hypothetical protein